MDITDQSSEDCVVFVINLDPDTEAFTNFCRKGAADLLGQKIPYFTFAFSSHQHRPTTSVLFGNWPRLMSTHRAIIDTVTETVNQQLKLKTNRNITLVFLANNAEQIFSSGAPTEITKNIPPLEKGRIKQICALTSGPDPNNSSIIRLLEPDMNIEGIFYIGDDPKSTYALDVELHYGRLRFILDLARDNGEIRDDLFSTIRHQQSSVLYQILLPTWNDHITRPSMTLAFLKNVLLSHLTPSDTTERINDFKSVIAEHVHKISKLSEHEIGSINIDLMKNILLKPIPSTKTKALKQLDTMEREISNALTHVTRKVIPTEVDAATSNVDEAFKNTVTDLRLSPPMAPKGDSSSTIPAAIEDAISTIANHNTTAREKALELRTKTPNGQLETDQVKQSFNDLKLHASKLPGTTLFYFLPAALVTLIIAVLIAQYIAATRSLTPELDIMITYLKTDLSQGYLLLLMVNILIALIWLNFKSKKTSRLLDKLKTNIIKLNYPLTAQTENMAKYRCNSRAAQYADELVSTLENQSLSRSVYDKIVQELRSIELPDLATRPEKFTDTEYLSAALERKTDATTLGLTTINFWQDQSPPSSTWAMRYERPVVSTITANTNISHKERKVRNSYMDSNQNVAVVPIETPVFEDAEPAS